MTDKIEEIRAALEGATPGPWFVEGELDILARDEGEPWSVAMATEPCGYPHDQSPANARLIALAPDMARIVLEQAEEIERLQKRVEAADQLATQLERAREADWTAKRDEDVDAAFMEAYKALAAYRATEDGE